MLKEVAVVETALNQATLAGDANRVDRLLDEGFIWTQHNGAQVTKQQVLANLRSGQLKYSKLETNNVQVSSYGDTAIVRGITIRQRSSMPGSTSGAGDPTPFTAYYTLTLINRLGEWKAVAMHTSRQ